MTAPALDRALAASPAVRAARTALGDRSAWIVGGAIRDALAGREVTDVDLALDGDPEAAARAIASAADGHPFELSGEFALWRVQARAEPWHLDVAALRGGSIDADLAARDFTVDAIATPLAGGLPLDPYDGAGDLERGVLRAVGERSFTDDPLRILRAARIAATLELSVDPGTLALARAEAARAADPAGERQLGELRGIVAGPHPVRGIALMDELGATPVVLPELEALRGVEQNPYHHLDAHGHTIEVLARVVELETDPSAALGELSSDVEALLAEPLADELNRAGGLRFAALFHDLGKPATRTVGEGGRVLFIGHDEEGVRIVADICARLRASRRLTSYLQSLTRNHLRLGFLVHERPLARRRVYEYLRATEPETVDVTLLTVADRLATKGPRTRSKAIESHLELAREMIAEGLEWRRSGPPTAPIRGDELAAELGIEPGPELGRLLGEIEAARFAGEATSRDDAIALARRLRSDVQ
ncbi:MAG TPA: HD domain-containing protein [Solirubrobacterales bacterium]|nr:HD domain-containing protein [Solirubrobacterales bacterium]